MVYSHETVLDVLYNVERCAAHGSSDILNGLKLPWRVFLLELMFVLLHIFQFNLRPTDISPLKKSLCDTLCTSCKPVPHEKNMNFNEELKPSPYFIVCSFS